MFDESSGALFVSDINKIKKLKSQIDELSRELSTLVGILSEKRKRPKTDRRMLSVSQYSLDGKLIATYRSAREAGRETGFSHSKISSCARGDRKQCYGYLWKIESVIRSSAPVESVTDAPDSNEVTIGEYLSTLNIGGSND